MLDPDQYRETPQGQGTGQCLDRRQLFANPITSELPVIWARFNCFCECPMTIPLGRLALRPVIT